MMVAYLILLAFTASDPPTADHAALLQAGRELLSALPAKEPDQEKQLYFVLEAGPKQTAGYAQVTLRPQGKDDEVTYEYASDTVVASGAGPRIAVSMRGTLRPTFEPVRAEMYRESLIRENERKASSHQAVFAGDTVTVNVDDGKDQVSVQVPRPEAPYVFGIEALMAELKAKRPPAFAIREFSVPTGKAELLIFSTEKWPSGGDTLIGRYADGSGAYQFWFDEKGELDRWMHASMPMLFVRSTKERVEELKKTLGPPMTIPPSAKGD
jgi:hypothetical protein